MRLILCTLQVGFTIFLIWNGRLLIFLTMEHLQDFIAASISKCRFNHKVKVSGVFYGHIGRKGLRRVCFQEPSLGGDIYLQVTPFTDVIPSTIPYGTQVIVYGKFCMYRGMDIVSPTSIICVNDNKKIKKELDRRLTISMLISILLEVLIYVIRLQGKFG